MSKDRDVEVVAASRRSVDRRIQRTQQLLQQAFMEVVQEKGFAATTIQDITERANVNRGTFYIHFEDKYKLLDTVIREQFHRQLASSLPPSPRWDRRSLRLLIQAVLDCFERKYHHRPPSLPVPAPILEQAMQEELTELLLTWLKQEKGAESCQLVPLETIARIAGWAIFGSAIQWSQEKTAVSLEQMADAILLVLMEGVARLVSKALPE